MNTQKIKAAMIGAGHWGKVLLAELEKQAEVLYTCTQSSNNLDQALTDQAVEAVFIATPTEIHFEIADQALEAGKHVFLEKPGTTSAADLEKLVKKAEDKNLKFAVGYEFPHHPAAKKIKELLADKKIQSIYFEWQKWGTFRDNTVPHLLSHEVSIMEYWGIEPEPVSCKKTKIISDTDIIETEFKNNISSVINRVSPLKQKTVTIITESGSYIWSNNQLFKIDDETQTLIEIPLPNTTPVAEEIKDFLDAVAEDHSPLINGEFALDVWRVLEKINS